MRIKIDRWEFKRFLHWWMCERNPDKQIEWLLANPWIVLYDRGLTASRTFTFPAEPDGPCLNMWMFNRMGIDDELDRIYGREHRQ